MTSKEFNILYTTHQKALVYFADQLLRNKDEAEDISQGAWVKLWLQIENGYEPRNVKSWLHSVTRNLCYDYLKHKAATSRVQSELLFLIKDIDYVDGLEIKSELLNRLLVAAESLLKRAKDVFYLWINKRLGTKQIASVMRTTENAIRIQRGIIVKHLRASLVTNKN
jgi:RNA polymerase sigma-70 factor (ECF subfamily)